MVGDVVQFIHGSKVNFPLFLDMAMYGDETTTVTVMMMMMMMVVMMMMTMMMINNFIAFDVRRTHPNLGHSVVVGYPVLLREPLKQVFSSFVCIFCAILNYVMCTCASRFFDYVIRRMCKTIAHLVVFCTWSDERS